MSTAWTPPEAGEFDTVHRLLYARGLALCHDHYATPLGVAPSTRQDSLHTAHLSTLPGNFCTVSMLSKSTREK